MAFLNVFLSFYIFIYTAAHSLESWICSWQGQKAVESSIHAVTSPATMVGSVKFNFSANSHNSVLDYNFCVALDHRLCLFCSFNQSINHRCEKKLSQSFLIFFPLYIVLIIRKFSDKLFHVYSCIIYK